MTTREKILLAVLLGCLVSWLSGCQRDIPIPQAPMGDVTDLPFLYTTYDQLNEAYFQNRLPAPVIDLSETTNMASTMCDEWGQNCTLKFNLKYVAAPRMAELTLAHEMCHVATWNKDMQSFGSVKEQVEHGRSWRACMIQMDTAGFNRQILIDNYGTE